MSLQPISLVPTSKHMWVFPCGEFVASFARDRAGAVAAEGHDARLATRVRRRVELEADEGQGRQARSRPGEPDGAALGLGAADGATLASGVGAADGGALSIGVTVAPAEGDAIATGGALGDAVAEPLRPTMTSIVTATTRTSRPARPATTLRRVRSLTGSSHACVRASYPTVAVTPAGGRSSQTRRRAIMAG